METHLARELKKYYQRIGNKIVFRNGMTQNELSVEMWGWLEEQGVKEPGVEKGMLSRVTQWKGERNFSLKHLEAFAAVVGLTGLEQIDLELALMKDRRPKHGQERDLSVSPYDVDHARASLQSISEARTQGHPQLVIQMATDHCSWLLQKVGAVSSARIAQELHRIRGRVLFEQAVAYQESVPQQILQDLTTPIADELRVIGSVSEDRTFFGLADFILGNTSYIKRQFYDSIGHYIQALENIESPDHQLWIQRTLSLNWASLKKKEKSEKAVTEVEKLIEGGQISDLDHICLAREGVARSQAELGIEGASKTLEAGWKDLAKREREVGRSLPFRAVELARSELVVIQHLAPNDKGRAEAIGSKWREVAKEYGYQRHEMLIQELLDASLNNHPSRPA